MINFICARFPHDETPTRKEDSNRKVLEAVVEVSCMYVLLSGTGVGRSPERRYPRYHAIRRFKDGR